MRLRTRVCDLLGIQYPVFAAGMGGVTIAPLAGAVSAAGGMGVLVPPSSRLPSFARRSPPCAGSPTGLWR